MDRVTVVHESLFYLKDQSALEAVFRLAGSEAGNLRLQKKLREMGIADRVRAGVVGVMSDDGSRLDAYCKVIFPGKGMFLHRELYINFPSDHLLTKILLGAG